MSDKFQTVANRITKMIELQGFYILGDRRQPLADTPVLSMGGKLYRLDIIGEIDTSQFPVTLTVQGPFRGSKVPVAYVYDGVPYLAMELDPLFLDAAIPLFVEQPADITVPNGMRLVSAKAAVEILPQSGMEKLT